jgi:hypothetical protein
MPKSSDGLSQTPWIKESPASDGDEENIINYDLLKPREDGFFLDDQKRAWAPAHTSI